MIKTRKKKKNGVSYDRRELSKIFFISSSKQVLFQFKYTERRFVISYYVIFYGKLEELVKDYCRQWFLKFISLLSIPFRFTFLFQRRKRLIFLNLW